MKRMSLVQFTAQLRLDIEAFEAMWMAKRSDDPRNWPLSQPTQEDWEDQFLAWVETRGGEKTK